MPTKDELIESLVKMVSKMEEPKLKERFADFNKTLQFHFTNDENATCYIIFEEGNATLKDGLAENPDFEITTTTDVIMEIIAKTLSPTRAFMSGKIKAKGAMKDLLKLQSLMK
jgi:putative sterol carrier protein